MLDIAANSEDTRRIYMINLTGRIDSGTARDFDDFFQELLRKGNRFLVLEAAGLEFVSSAGIASLVGLARKLNSLSGAAAFLRLNDEIRMVLEFFGLSRELPAFDTLKDARQYLDSRVHNKNLSLELKKAAIDPGTIVPSDQDIGALDEVITEAPGPGPGTAAQTRTADQGPRPLGAAAQAVSSDAVPIQDMESDDFKMLIRRNVREVLRSEGLTQAPSTAPAGTSGSTSQNSGAGSSGMVAAGVAGAGLLGAAAGAVAATALSKSGNSSEPENSQTTNASTGTPNAGSPGAGATATSRPASLEPEPGPRGSKASAKIVDRSKNGPTGKSGGAKATRRIEKKAPPQSGGDAPVNFSEPKTIKCEQCGEQLRVARRGTYLCPACRIKIRVRGDGTATFLERL